MNHAPAPAKPASAPGAPARWLWRRPSATLVDAASASPELADLTWDGYKLRVQPPLQYSEAWDGVSLLGKNPTKAMLPLHRDTWGSNIQSQVRACAQAP